MIIHADMDAYYASVEIRENPSLADKPVVVGGDADRRGVVSAANYIARQYGIRSAMPMKQAKQKCACLVICPGRIDLYAEISKQIREIFNRYTPLVEPLSLDEAFLDVSKSKKLFGDATKIGHRIKNDIAEELKLVVSIGIAANKFIAKIASDINKPAGFVFVKPGTEQVFLDPLPLTRIWGIGKKTNEKLAKFGLETVQQLRQMPDQFLQQQFGKHGQHIWRLANGIDNRKVISESSARSISHERTFAVDIKDKTILLSQLSDLTEQVAWRLRNSNVVTSTVQLKMRLSDFSTITRAKTLASPSNSTDTLWPTIRALFEKEYPLHKKAIRLIGMGTTKISDQENGHTLIQADLFAPTKEEQNKIDKLTDSINQKFKGKMVKRGSSVKSKSD